MKHAPFLPVVILPFCFCFNFGFVFFFSIYKSTPETKPEYIYSSFSELLKNPKKIKKTQTKKTENKPKKRKPQQKRTQKTNYQVLILNKVLSLSSVNVP